MKVVSYVSGHGYGHAVRQAELARELAARAVEVVFISSADPEAFWPMAPGARLIRAAIDVGVLQPGSLEVDEPGTLNAFERFSDEWPMLVAVESARLAALNPDLVIADIAPLGILAARRAGLPVVLIANFTWDWIYEAWQDRDPRATALAARCTEAYRQADVVLRLPLSGGLDRFARSEPMPLLVRHARRRRDELRRELGVAPGQSAVLVAFGGFGPPGLPAPVDIDPACVQFFGYTDLGWPSSLYRQLDRRIYEHPELVAAADLVLGKPGYGTVGECSVHGTRMLWMDRERFPEVEVLVQGILDHVGGVQLDRARLARGELRPALSLALRTAPRRGPLAGDGAARIADRLFDLVKGRS